MKKISREYEVPISVCWDIWKIKTTMKMKQVLAEIDRKFD